MPAGQHPAVATAARVPASFCQAAAGGCGALSYAPAHLRCAAVTLPVGWRRGGGGGGRGGGARPGIGLLRLMLLEMLGTCRVFRVRGEARWGVGEVPKGAEGKHAFV